LWRFFWDYLMSQFQKKSSCGLYGAMGDIRGRDTDNAAGRHSIQTDQWPTSLIPPIFTPDALPAATLPNMLACVRSRLVCDNERNDNNNIN